MREKETSMVSIYKEDRALLDTLSRSRCESRQAILHRLLENERESEKRLEDKPEGSTILPSAEVRQRLDSAGFLSLQDAKKIRSKHMGGV